MKHFKKILCSAALFVAASAAHGQTIFSDDFESENTTTPLAGQNGYTTNDPENGTLETATTQVGGLSAVANPGIGTGQAGQLFGGYTAGAITGYPGTSPVFVTHAVPLSSYSAAVAANGYSFNTDFLVSSSGNGANSTYEFNFLNGTTSAFSIAFSPDPAHPGVAANTATVPGYTTGGGAIVPTTSGLVPALDSVYHLTITVSPTGTVNASFYGAGAPGNVVQIGTFTSATALTINEFAVEQISPVAPTAGTQANDNITFDNLAITTVPEPSTYAMMALGLVGMIGLMKFRRTV